MKNVVHPKPEDRILDIGCGPGDILQYIPDAKYVGIDINEKYIDAARSRYGDRATFVCERVSNFVVKEHPAYTIVLAVGVLHHLDDDEAHQLVALAHAALKPGGRLITCDPVYHKNQPCLDRLFRYMDRGRYIRSEEDYSRLISELFEAFSSSIVQDFILLGRLPLTTIAYECTR